MILAVPLPHQTSTDFTNTISIEPHIQFTVEIETDRQLPFLDFLLRREADGSISTSIYRSLYRQVSGFCPTTSTGTKAHKAAVVHALMSSAQSLPSFLLAGTDEEVGVTACSPIYSTIGYPLEVIRTLSTLAGVSPGDDPTKATRP